MNAKVAWWKGVRGEWYVVFQAILGALLFFGPRNAFGLSWPVSAEAASTIAGGVLIALGGVVSLIAAFNLGANLTPLPFPKDNSSLVVTGLYSLVRHPIYCGVILMAIGWALFVQGWLTLVYALVFVPFFDIKSRREEVWLQQHFPEYAEYRERVRKLIPFLY